MAKERLTSGEGGEEGGSAAFEVSEDLVEGAWVLVMVMLNLCFHGFERRRRNTERGRSRGRKEGRKKKKKKKEEEERRRSRDF
jgi:hypothetical protein